MSVVRVAGRVITQAADATTAAVGAVGGAAVTAVIGAAEGTAAGVKNGVRRGSHSTTAAALTLAAVGVAGLVDWPIVAIAGGAVAIHELNRRFNNRQQPGGNLGRTLQPAPTPRRAKNTTHTASASR